MHSYLHHRYFKLVGRLIKSNEMGLLQIHFRSYRSISSSQILILSSARGQNLVHIQKIGFLHESFLEVLYFDNHMSGNIHTLLG